MTRTTRPTRVLGLRARSVRGARKGITAMLAMLYLVIFSALAIGFYGAVTLASQVAANDERSTTARLATESGLQYVRYQLSQVKYPSNTEPGKIVEEVWKQLVAQTQGAPNLGGRPIIMSAGTIYFPLSSASDDYYIPLDAKGGEFRAMITDLGSTDYNEDGRPRRNVRKFKVKVVGRHHASKICRAVEMEYIGDFKFLNIFDFGVGVRGPISIGGSGGVFGPNSLEGSLLTTTTAANAISVSGNATVAGDLFMTNKNGGVSLSSGSSVGGTKGPDKYDHVHKGIDEPEFPVVDSSPFLPFATTVYTPGLTTYRNTIVPANTNPSFNGDTTIEGVMYVKYPNRLKFLAKAVIKGVIVVENGAKASPNNTIDFGGGIEAYGMDTLPDYSSFPEGMKKLRGSVLLAPGYAVTLRGTSGTIGGTMVADSFDLAGGSGGVVKGNMIGLGTTMGFNISGGGQVQRTRGDDIPSGTIFTFTVKPLINTYLEVTP